MAPTISWHFCGMYSRLPECEKARWAPGDTLKPRLSPVSLCCLVPAVPPHPPCYAPTSSDGRGLRESVTIIWRTGLCPLPNLISSTGRLGCWAHQQPPTPPQAPGDSREASILALLGMAGSPVSTWVAGTAVQGHLAVSALEEKAAMRTPGRAKGVSRN